MQEISMCGEKCTPDQGISEYPFKSQKMGLMYFQCMSNSFKINGKKKDDLLSGTCHATNKMELKGQLKLMNMHRKKEKKTINLEQGLLNI